MFNMKEEDSIEFKLQENINDKNYFFNSILLTKNQFKKINNSSRFFEFLNQFENDKYDLVIIYQSVRNNSKEINYIKCMLTSLYFANRIVNENVEFESSEVFENIIENMYRDKCGNYIQLKSPIKIGCQPADMNSFNESIMRLYGVDLDSEYEGYTRYLNLYNHRNSELSIDYNDSLVDEIDKICKKLNDKSEYSKRMISTFRLYFDTIPEFDLEKNILNYATIFETLLLSDDEIDQRKKVSARGACLLCDGLSFNSKEYIAEIIYQFYSYRNKIVHKGYSYLDLGDEIFVDKMLNCIKNIIYSLIKRIITKDIKNIEDIKSIVEENKKKDCLKSAFHYVKNDTTLEHAMLRIISCQHYEFIGCNTKK